MTDVSKPVHTADVNWRGGQHANTLGVPVRVAAGTDQSLKRPETNSICVDFSNLELLILRCHVSHPRQFARHWPRLILFEIALGRPQTYENGIRAVPQTRAYRETFYVVDVAIKTVNKRKYADTMAINVISYNLSRIVDCSVGYSLWGKPRQRIVASAHANSGILPEKHQPYSKTT